MPINADACMRVTDIPIWIARLGMLLPLVLLFVLARKGCKRLSPKFLLFLLAWASAPLLLLCVPLGPVHENLDKSRMLVLPSIAWAFGLAALIAPARVRYPRTTVGAVVALIALGFASFHLGLGSYERASLRANRVIREIRRMASPGSRTLLLAVENPRTGEGIHP
jgi:hypothetical protein